jgi:hypothetical protein
LLVFTFFRSPQESNGVAARAVDDHCRNFSCRVSFKLHLGTSGLHEELRFGVGKQRNVGFPAELQLKTISFHGDLRGGIAEVVRALVASKNPNGDRNCLSFSQRNKCYKDLPKGRKRAGWKKDFLRSVQKAAADLGDILEETILSTVREYRSGRKKLPEITVVARTKKKTA